MPPDILIVDDLPNWRRQMQDVLASGGYTTVAVASSAEARRMLSSGRFKLAVIDVRLVDADEANVEGLELLEEIDRDNLDIKVIVMTGHEPAKAEERAQTSPRLVTFINKGTLDVSQFLAAVEQSIEASR